MGSKFTDVEGAEASRGAVVIPLYRGAGVARVSTLRPMASVPIAASDGTLALEYDVQPTPPVADPVGDFTPTPALRRFAHRFCAAMLEVLAGDRGPQQLLGCTTEAVYDELVARAAALAKTSPSRSRRRPQVRSVHVFCPTADAAEVSAHVSEAGRSRAIAARLEYLDDQWTCVAVAFG